MGFADLLNTRMCSRSVDNEGKWTFLGVAGVLWGGVLSGVGVEAVEERREGVLGAERARM